MNLSPAFLSIAFRLQEAATAMCHEDIRTRIADALKDAAKSTTNDYYGCYVAAIFGDDKSGDVVFSCGYGDGLKRAPYTISGANCTIDMAQAVDVQPFTTYQVETGDVQATEAGARNSKHDLKQLQAIHDSAMALGATCAKMTESDVSRETPGSVKLTEAAAFQSDIRIAEALKTGFKIKLIAPGKGSTAFYPAEVLKRDGPKVFKAGTPMRIDHPTMAEESARPEGSVKDWGAVLASDAQWLDNHPQGPGLYSEVKAFSDHAQLIEEKGPYAGVSIRACGTQAMENGRPVVKDGVPLLASLVSADGVDMVTRAGAGGMFLQESALPIPSQKGGQVEMDEAAIKSLVESSVQAATKPLKERALRGDAFVIAGRVLANVDLPAVAKQRVIEATLTALPLNEAGAVDEKAYTDLVIAESKREAAYIDGLTGGSGVRHMGPGSNGSPVETDPVKIAEARRTRAEADKLDLAEGAEVFAAIGLGEKAAKRAAEGRPN